MDDDNNNQQNDAPQPGQPVTPEAGNPAQQTPVAPQTTPDPQPTQPSPPQPAANFNQPQPTVGGGEDPGKGMSIAAIIFAFLVPLVGLILGIIANKKSKEAGHKNGLAKAAIILSSVFMVIGLLIGIFAATVGFNAAKDVIEQCQQPGATTYTVDGQVYSCTQ